jgi:acid phosphatase
VVAEANKALYQQHHCIWCPWGKNSTHSSFSEVDNNMTMNRLFLEAVGIMVMSMLTVSIMSLSSSFVTPVFSLVYSSARSTPGVFKDSKSQLLLSTIADNSVHNNKEWLLNLRGGTNFGGDNDTKDNSAANTGNDTSFYSYRTVQVQVIHRHGDRTPITPLKNEEFWTQQLVPEDLLEKVASGTRVLRQQRSGDDEDNANSGKNKLEVHAAAGRGPFGKLTQLGLLGMIQVGTTLKEDLEDSTEWSERTTASSIVGTTDGSSRRIRFAPNDIKVYSTDFPRTIQSVQALLVGFFPDGFSDNDIDIDCRDTTCWMIPDPQPRQTKEQEVLERQLAKRPHVLEREALMRPLAARCTQSLVPLLGEGAFQLSFGVEEDNSQDDDDDIDTKKKDKEYPALPWIQLTEITKCLSVRDMLPDSITKEDQEALSAHTAWKWFQSLRSPRLAYLSMRRFTEILASTLQRREEEPPLIVYSCHDSSLVGLLCALHLDQPSVWPEYGAVLKMELLEKKQNGDDTLNYVVRFFLNGELLKSMWNDTPREEISMDEFISLISTERVDVEKS